ncbi:hypothetical protein CAOG_009632 [Capsaspora owczarzaki ATCC 30864]|uniref:Uncharacterized protein n=1 Tax=Capsaspora owczarzaki (strain ATCC 30864) TaxID=595528 RepID=A0A0D2WMM8_CAPO3|nr:hypothetical protein CAOG_009632 [Capsaspora owczarzaki ATCC 30864]
MSSSQPVSAASAGGSGTDSVGLVASIASLASTGAGPVNVDETNHGAAVKVVLPGALPATNHGFSTLVTPKVATSLAGAVETACTANGSTTGTSGAVKGAGGATQDVLSISEGCGAKDGETGFAARRLVNRSFSSSRSSGKLSVGRPGSVCPASSGAEAGLYDEIGWWVSVAAPASA